MQNGTGVRADRGGRETSKERLVDPDSDPSLPWLSPEKPRLRGGATGEPGGGKQIHPDHSNPL